MRGAATISAAIKRLRTIGSQVENAQFDGKRDYAKIQFLRRMGYLTYDAPVKSHYQNTKQRYSKQCKSYNGVNK